jgi:hypothetical protein
MIGTHGMLMSPGTLSPRTCVKVAFWDLSGRYQTIPGAPTICKVPWEDMVHLRDLQEKKHSILKRIEELDPGRDFEFDQPEEYHDYCPDELRHWTLWKADEDWNPIPPSWRLWPIGRGKKEEVARILHEVHEEIRLAKQRLREMETSDSDLTDHT